MTKKRKVCFVITSPIHYSRNFLILEELKKRKDVELHIVLGGSVLLDKYISRDFNVKKILENEKYTNIHEAHFNLDGDKKVIKSKTVGLGIIEFSSIFNEIEPDVVVVRGDRFEVLSAALAAAYMNIPIAHIEGGDVSGTLDESIRHAITKISQIHFATNDDAFRRLIRMGERKEYVFNFGSPDVEVAKNLLKKDAKEVAELDANMGSGADFNPQEDFIMVMYHPVTSEIENLASYTRELLAAVSHIGIQVLWFWPNMDAGSESISHELRVFRDHCANSKIRFLRYLHPKRFLALLSETKCLVGNSSAGIKECSYMGIPVVDVGRRQCNRLKSKNVVCCGNSSAEIQESILKQLKKNRYVSSGMYHSNDTSKEIARIISTIDLYTQKNFVD